jgi:hypothetical protein
MLCDAARCPECRLSEAEDPLISVGKATERLGHHFGFLTAHERCVDLWLRDGRVLWERLDRDHPRASLRHVAADVGRDHREPGIEPLTVEAMKRAPRTHEGFLCGLIRVVGCAKLPLTEALQPSVVVAVQLGEHGAIPAVVKLNELLVPLEIDIAVEHVRLCPSPGATPRIVPPELQRYR